MCGPSRSSGWTVSSWDPADDWDRWQADTDDLPDVRDDDEEREPAPMFGCACENPLSVDTVCPGCIEWLQERYREASEPPQSTPKKIP